MKIENVDLKNGAVVIADVHYKKGDEFFLSLLKKWVENPPVQVFFLGDIFHLLLPFKYLLDYNSEAVKLIKKLSIKTDIFYTPGNHDFNIEKIFPDIKFSDAFYDDAKKVFLTHGDLTDTDFFYGIYTKIIRNGLVESILNAVSLNFVNHWLFKKILAKKISCKKLYGFEKKIKEKLKKSDYGIIIEGHYHQNKVLHFNGTEYINLPAFICTKSYILIQLDNNPIIKEIKYDGR